MKNILQTIAGFAFGGILLYFTLEGKDLGQIFDALVQADLGITLLCVFFMTGILCLRAARWQLLLKEAGEKVPFLHVLTSLGIGYFVNSFTPKLGEIIRCTTLQKSSNVSLAKNFGVVVSERVYDLIVIFGGVFLIFLIEIDRLGHLFRQVYVRTIGVFSSTVLWLALIGGIACCGAIFIYRNHLLKLGFVQKLYHFLQEMYQAILSSFKLKQYWLFLFYTFAILFLLIFLNYLFLQALEVTSDEGLYFGSIVLFIAAVGWALPAPGGIGTSHFLILHLFLVFGMSEDAGIVFGIYSNGLTFVFTIAFGLLTIIHYFLRARHASVSGTIEKEN